MAMYCQLHAMEPTLTVPIEDGRLSGLGSMWSFFRKKEKSGAVAQAFNASTGEGAEAVGSLCQSSLVYRERELQDSQGYVETLSQTKPSH